MGENLYGNPSLALRELYQNAVDACRLAAARREYRGTAPEPGTDDVPEIEMEQGIDSEGRPFIDCVDLGAGMGLAELSQAFCQAGVRDSDLRERQAEREDFEAATPPVVLWQNSRFGIGVMSYFMVADAITVTTAMLNRDGSTGDLLSMHITGPASQFTVVTHGPSAAHGTRVRLWLKPSAAVSAIATLRELVLVCPLRLRVFDHRGLEHRWLPGELNRGSSKLMAADRATQVGHDLWWVDGTGAVLADGIWINAPIFGIIINLTGEAVPDLTADREGANRLDVNLVSERAVAQAEHAVERAWHIVGNSSWLNRLCLAYPRVADAIVRAAFDRPELEARVHGRPYRLGVSGNEVFDEIHSADEPVEQVRWRFSRLRAAGLYESIGIATVASPALVAALPSDSVLLGNVWAVVRDEEYEETSPWFRSTASIYDAERLLGYGVQHIVRRARVLGLPLPEHAERLPNSCDAVRASLSFERRVDSDDKFRPVSAFDVQQASWRLDLAPSAIVHELEVRGIELEERARTLESSPPGQATLIAASLHANGIAPWATPRSVIELTSVIEAVRATSVDFEEVIAELAGLGFPNLPRLRMREAELAQAFSPDDLLLLSADLDGRAPFLSIDSPARKRHARKAAERLGRSEASVSERLAAFGVPIGRKNGPSSKQLTKKQVFRLLGLPASEGRTLSPRLLRLMSRDGDGVAPWLDPRQPVPAWLVATVALHGRRLDAVMHDFARLGYTVEDPRDAPLTINLGPGA